MQELADRLREWERNGTPFALATVVGIRGSAPRPAGAAMAVGADGEVVGSVSGGCVEGAIYELASSLLPDKEASLTTYGISDDEAFSVGLTCGGILDVLVAPVDRDGAHLLDAVMRSEAEREPVALATVIRGEGLGARLAVWPDRTEGSLGHPELDANVAADTRGMLALGQTGSRHFGLDGERMATDLEVFIQSFAPAPHMIVFGAIDFASAVARIGVYLGYYVTVCDARPVFATKKRFPEAHEVICEWPHRYLEHTRVDERTVICVLTHDPKFDIPALERALQSRAEYVGAMGSRRTHANRIRRLRETGLAEDLIAKLKSPIGLDIGARTPEETAVSIAADIIRHRWNATGLPLVDQEGPIHRGLERAEA